jgi:hypothetical protein
MEWSGCSPLHSCPPYLVLRYLFEVHAQPHFVTQSVKQGVILNRRYAFTTILANLFLSNANGNLSQKG